MDFGVRFDWPTWLIAALTGIVIYVLLESLCQDPDRGKQTRSLSIEGSRAVRTVQGFELWKRIGKGAFGEVWLASQAGADRLYAIKILDKGNMVSKGIVDKAISESLILQRLSRHPSPFIVGLYNAFQDDEALYLALDYVGGGDLFELTHPKNGRLRLTDQAVRFYAAELTLALEYLHKHNIIFRDLKPENVLIGVDGHAVLTDFGLSKQQLQDVVSRTRTLVGTPDYMAPELTAGAATNAAPHAHEVDWWALGVICYELFTGKLPFSYVSDSALFPNLEQGPQWMVDPTAKLVGPSDPPPSLTPNPSSTNLAAKNTSPSPSLSRPSSLTANAASSQTSPIPNKEEKNEDKDKDRKEKMKGKGEGREMEIKIAEEDRPSKEFFDFVTALLNKDSERRLGHGGASEVKTHPFFQGILWSEVAVKQLKAPLLPANKDIGLVAPNVNPAKNQDLFKDFNSKSTIVEGVRVEDKVKQDEGSKVERRSAIALRALKLLQLLTQTKPNKNRQKDGNKEGKEVDVEEEDRRAIEVRVQKEFEQQGEELIAPNAFFILQGREYYGIAGYWEYALHLRDVGKGELVQAQASAGSSPGSIRVRWMLKGVRDGETEVITITGSNIYHFKGDKIIQGINSYDPWSSVSANHPPTNHNHSHHHDVVVVPTSALIPPTTNTSSTTTSTTTTTSEELNKSNKNKKGDHLDDEEQGGGSVKVAREGDEEGGGGEEEEEEGEGGEEGDSHFVISPTVLPPPNATTSTGTITATTIATITTTSTTSAVT